MRSHYHALIKKDVPNLNKKIWKLKAPLKVKIFLWYLRKGVILTKDNLTKRNWQGSKSCCFCHKDESIKHLFFECRFARTVWAIFSCAAGIAAPINAFQMFDSWVQGLPSTPQSIALLGAAAICWSIWLCRNDLVFEKKNVHSPLQVILAAVRWVRTWVILQSTEAQFLAMEASQLLTQVAIDIFFRAHGWRSSLRIEHL